MPCQLLLINDIFFTQTIVFILYIYMFKTKIEKKTYIKFLVNAIRRGPNSNSEYENFENNENFKNYSRDLNSNKIYDLQNKRPLFPPPPPPLPLQKPYISIFEKGVTLLSKFFTNIENGFYTNVILFYILVFLILNCGISLALLFNLNL